MRARVWVTGLFLCLATLPVALAGACVPPREVVAPADLRATVPGASAVVVVHSRSGHTARMARGLAKALGADFVRIQGSGDEGDSWLKTPSWTSRVPITPESIDMRPYKLVLIGGPIWYWRPNALVHSFIEASDLHGKNVVLFYTFEGGAMSASTEATWRRWVEDRGGAVRDVVGIDRKKLPKGVDEAAEAERIARERMNAW